MKEVRNRPNILQEQPVGSHRPAVPEPVGPAPGAAAPSFVHLAPDTWIAPPDERAAFEKRLAEALARHTDVRGVVVIAPTVGWGIHAFQRPHHLALAFARQGYLVFFCLHRTSLEAPTGLRQVEERLYLFRMPGDLLSCLEGAIVLVLPYNAGYARHMCNPVIVYDFLDDLEVFPYDPRILLDNHLALLLVADLVLPTATRLADHVRPFRPDARLVPNAVSFEDFAAARAVATPAPSDLHRLLKLGQPIVGYYGALANWVDFDLLHEMAVTRPDLTFVFIGRDHGNHLQEEQVFQCPNVHWLGSRAYHELPPYLRHFDVATIPFRVNAITLATSPLKLFEYFAGRKPVVSTPLPECQQYAEVFIGTDAHEFSTAIDRALAARGDTAFLDRLEALALANTWEARVQDILQALDEAKWAAARQSHGRRALLPAAQARWREDAVGPVVVPNAAPSTGQAAVLQSRVMELENRLAVIYSLKIWKLMTIYWRAMDGVRALKRSPYVVLRPLLSLLPLPLERWLVMTVRSVRRRFGGARAAGSIEPPSG